MRALIRPVLACLLFVAGLTACSDKTDQAMTLSSKDTPAQASTLTADSGHPGPNAAAGALNPAPRSPNTSD